MGPFLRSMLKCFGVLDASFVGMWGLDWQLDEVGFDSCVRKISFEVVDPRSKLHCSQNYVLIRIYHSTVFLFLPPGLVQEERRNHGPEPKADQRHDVGGHPQRRADPGAGGAGRRGLTSRPTMSCRSRRVERGVRHPRRWRLKYGPSFPGRSEGLSQIPRCCFHRTDSIRAGL